MNMSSVISKVVLAIILAVVFVLFLMKVKTTQFFLLQVLVIIGLIYLLFLRKHPLFIIALYTFGYSAYSYFAKTYFGVSEGIYRYMFVVSIIVLADTVISNRTNKVSNIFNRFVFFLFALYACGYLYSMVGDGDFAFADYHYGRFLTFTLYPIILVLLFCKNLKDIQTILKVIALIGVFITLVALTDINSMTIRGDHQAVQALGRSSNSIARTLMICSLTAIYFYWKTDDKYSSLFWLAVAVSTVGVAALAQSKQAIFSYALSFLIFLYLAPRKNAKASLILFGVVFLGLLMVIKEPEFFTRMTDFANDPSGETWLRSYYYHNAWNRFLDNPIMGTGVGSNYHPRTGEREFPHNLFLEAASEMGVVGISLIVILFYIVIKRIRRIYLLKPLEPEYKLLTATLVAIIFFNVLAAQVSGSIGGNGRIWFFSILLWPLYKSLLKSKEFAE